MTNLKSLSKPCILVDYENSVYYCYDDNNTVFTSNDLNNWTKLSSTLPLLTHMSVIKVRNEYRIYGEKDGKIYLYVSTSPERDFILRDRVIGPEDTDMDYGISYTSPFIFCDPLSKDHFLIYKRGKYDIFSLHINPRNGLSFEETPGTLVACMPEYNDSINHGSMYYSKEYGLYYLFISSGNEFSGSIRYGVSSKPNGIFKDFSGKELTDKNNFDDSLGFMPLAPMHFDDCDYVNSYVKPALFNGTDNKTYFSCLAYTVPESTYSLPEFHNRTGCITSFMIEPVYNTGDSHIPFLMLPYGISPDFDHTNDSHATEDIAGHYEYICLKKLFPLSICDYTELSVLSTTDNGVSSTRNSWALSIPHTSGGHVELGGSLRGYWLFNNRQLLIRYNNYTQYFNILKVKINSTDTITTFLIGTDSQGNVVMAKKFRS